MKFDLERGSSFFIIVLMIVIFHTNYARRGRRRNGSGKFDR